MAEKSSASSDYDATDIEIMKILQKDARAKHATISKKVNKGIYTVHARMKRLKDEGFIKKYSAVLDEKKLGRGTLAFILVTVTYRVPGGEQVISQRNTITRFLVINYKQKRTTCLVKKSL